MRKPEFSLCKSKGADQLRSKCEIRNFKLLAIFCANPARFVSDLVGNPEDRFSRNTALLLVPYTFVSSVLFWNSVFLQLS